MMYSRPSGVNPPRPFAGHQVPVRRKAGRRRRWCRRWGRRRRGTSLRYQRTGQVDAVAARHLFDQRTVGVDHDEPRHRLHEDPIFLGQLIGATNEDPARSVDEGRFRRRSQGGRDLLLQVLAVDGRVFVPDHEIGDEPFETPVGVGLDDLASDVSVGLVADAQQDDGQIARDAVGPQGRLTAAVARDDAGGGAHRRIGIEDASGHLFVQLRLGVGDAELLEKHLAVRPGKIQNAIGRVSVAIFVDQGGDRGSGLGHPGHDVNARCVAGFNRDAAPDGQDGIQDRTGAVAQRLTMHRRRIDGRSAAADERGSIRLVGDRTGALALNRDQVEGPGRPLLARARPARPQDRVALADQLGLDEEVAEHRVRGVRGGRREHQLGERRQLDRLRGGSPVRHAHATDLDVVLGRNADLRVQLKVAIPAAELGAPLREDRFVASGRPE